MNAIDKQSRVAWLMHQARGHWSAGQIGRAAQNYHDAIGLDPDNGLAVFYLAELRGQAGHYDAGLFEQACKLLEQTISRNCVANVETWTCYGGALGVVGRLEEAIEVLRATVDLWPLNLVSHHILSSYALLAGDLVLGFAEKEFRTGRPCLNAGGRPAPRWRGEDLTDKTIILMREQGFGDVFQLARYIPMVAGRGARVLLRAGVMNKVLASIDGVAGVIQDDDPLPDFDYCAGLCSMPAVFQTDLSSIPATVPYIHARPADWLDHLPGMKVGLCWAGKSYAYRNDDPLLNHRRSVPLLELAPLLEVQGCSFVSLQIGPPAAELERIPAGCVHDMSNQLNDWADTAAVIAGLDLVIAVDTAVVHLAGALGKPVWLLNRYDTCWRWLLERADSPWYPTLRLYRQTQPGDWTSVIARVAADLKRLAATD